MPGDVIWTKDVPQKEGRYWTASRVGKKWYVSVFRSQYPGHRVMMHNETTHYSAEPLREPPPPPEIPAPPHE